MGNPQPSPYHSDMDAVQRPYGDGPCVKVGYKIWSTPT